MIHSLWCMTHPTFSLHPILRRPLSRAPWRYRLNVCSVFYPSARRNVIFIRQLSPACYPFSENVHVVHGNIWNFKFRTTQSRWQSDEIMRFLNGSTRISYISEQRESERLTIKIVCEMQWRWKTSFLTHRTAQKEGGVEVGRRDYAT